MAPTKLLFIPGYFGSTLVEKDSKALRWVRISDFFSNVHDLNMTESYSDLPKKHDLVDDQILYKIKLIPKILEIESYDKTLKHLKSFCHETNRELHTVTYDWRDDFYASIVKVGKKILELSASGEKIEVVAHSNGGILISYFLRFGLNDFFAASENWEGCNYVSKVSIVASPLHGAFSLFKHMKDGTTVLKNKKLMGSLDYTSFRSSYFFLPPRKFHQGYIGKQGDILQEFDLYNVDNWKKYKWGPYKDEHQALIPVNDQKFKTLLSRAEKFQELMQSEVSTKPTHPVSIQVLRGVGRKTYFYPTFISSDSIANYHYPKEDRENGDGVVAHQSGEPLHWFSHHRLTYETLNAEHLKIISEHKYQKHIHHFLSAN
jgi:hypothetical protein